MKELKSYISLDKDLSIRNQCELPGVNRSCFYYQAIPESQENLDIMRLMDQYYLDHPTYGVLQMQDYINGLGYHVNEKRIRRLLRKMNIMAIYPKRNLSKLGNAEYIRPYLLKGLEINEPNQVWEIDITYIPMKKGFMYLIAIIDVYSRFIVGWKISNSLEALNCIIVLKEAIRKYGLPQIVNSDQGSQFTSALWIKTLDDKGIKISMDGKDRAIDNIYIERFWRTLKQDYVYITPIDDGLELYYGLKDFFMHYNYNKTNQGINRMKPAELYVPSAS